MGRFSVRGLAGLLMMVWLLFHGGPAKAVDFGRTEVQVVGQDGQSHLFRVELATTAEQHAQGLMYRPSLAADGGMLFDFHQPQLINMWMKNTLIPLDMLFIDAGGQIRTIAQRTIPQSTTVISSRAEVLAVLELAGGTAARLKIVPGDHVVHPMFQVVAGQVR